MAMNRFVAIACAGGVGLIGGAVFAKLVPRSVESQTGIPDKGPTASHAPSQPGRDIADALVQAGNSVTQRHLWMVQAVGRAFLHKIASRPERGT